MKSTWLRSHSQRFTLRHHVFVRVRPHDLHHRTFTSHAAASPPPFCQIEPFHLWKCVHGAFPWNPVHSQNIDKNVVWCRKTDFGNGIFMVYTHQMCILQCISLYRSTNCSYQPTVTVDLWAWSVCRCQVCHTVRVVLCTLVSCWRCCTVGLGQ